MDTLIAGSNIIKTFGEGIEKVNILDGLSVNIRRGEFVSVMGPSGCGKSTLLYVLSGMDTVDSGVISFDGRALSSFNEKTLAELRRTRMGFVFQQPTLLRSLNVLDNILFPVMRNGRKKREELVAKAKSLMMRTGIAGLESRDITQASGGQLQRVGICRALMGGPEIIFCDEPTGALNSSSANEVMNLISGIHRDGVTILLVTHDSKVAARADRILFMKDGRIGGEYTPGTYDEKKEDLNLREKELANWLEKMSW